MAISSILKVFGGKKIHMFAYGALIVTLLGGVYQIWSLNNEIENKQEEISELKGEIGGFKRDISSLKGQRQNLQEKIEEQNVEIEQWQQEAEEQREEREKRLAQLREEFESMIPEDVENAEEMNEWLNRHF